MASTMEGRHMTPKAGTMSLGSQDLEGARRAREGMTGDSLITALVQAPDQAAADAIAHAAPARAVSEAADLLYLTDDPHGLAWYRRAVAREARA